MIDSGYSFAGMKTLSKDQLWYGDLIYANTNGDMNYGDENDREFTGHSSSPKFNLGFNASCSYKNIDFSMVWAGAFGHYLYWDTNYYNSTLVSHGYGIMQNIADNHYFYDPSNENDPRTNIQGKYPRMMYGTVNNNRNASNWYEYKADYLKLKNIQIGYTIPQSLTNKFFVSRLRAFVSMDNILTITSYPGQDPEIGTSIGYPLMRQISFGGQITF
jgi:TonB dependent receptor.